MSYPNALVPLWSFFLVCLQKTWCPFGFFLLFLYISLSELAYLLNRTKDLSEVNKNDLRMNNHNYTAGTEETSNVHLCRYEMQILSGHLHNETTRRQKLQTDRWYH